MVHVCLRRACLAMFHGHSAACISCHHYWLLIRGIAVTSVMRRSGLEFLSIGRTRFRGVVPLSHPLSERGCCSCSLEFLAGLTSPYSKCLTAKTMLQHYNRGIRGSVW